MVLFNRVGILPGINIAISFLGKLLGCFNCLLNIKELETFVTSCAVYTASHSPLWNHDALRQAWHAVPSKHLLLYLPTTNKFLQTLSKALKVLTATQSCASTTAEERWCQDTQPPPLLPGCGKRRERKALTAPHSTAPGKDLLPGLYNPALPKHSRAQRAQGQLEKSVKG